MWSGIRNVSRALRNVCYRPRQPAVKMPGTALPTESDQDKSSPQPFWEQTWFLTLLLIALVLVAYSRVFYAGFIWDDESHLTKNPCIVGPLGLKEVWTTP